MKTNNELKLLRNLCNEPFDLHMSVHELRERKNSDTNGFATITEQLKAPWLTFSPSRSHKSCTTSRSKLPRLGGKRSSSKSPGTTSTDTVAAATSGEGAD